MSGRIEFLDPEPEPGDDDQLTMPGRHRQAGPSGRPGRSGRPALPGRLLGGGAVALVAGLLVARGVTSGQRTPVASPSGSLSTDGSVTASRAYAAPASHPPITVSVDPSTGRIADTATQSCLPSDQIGQTIKVASLPALDYGSSDAAPPGSPAVPRDATCTAIAPAQCPEADDGQIACLVTRSVPLPVLQAVHLRYPAASVVFAYTEIARQTRLVWYRMIRLSVGRRSTLVITVEQSGNDPGRSRVVDDSVTQQVLAIDRGPRVNTVIDLIAPSAQRVDFELPTALASDARLVTPD